MTRHCFSEKTLWKMGLGHTQSRSPIYLFAFALINWELVAVDIPPFFRKSTLKNGVRAYKSPMSNDMGRRFRGTTQITHLIFFVFKCVSHKFNALIRNFLLLFQKLNSWMIFAAFRIIISHQFDYFSWKPSTATVPIIVINDFTSQS